jgi:hypothetical protein
MPTIKIPTAHLFVAIFVFFFATTASALNDLPQLSTIETAAIEYTENQGAVFITELITVEDTENDNIDGATITITGNYQAGQRLSRLHPNQRHIRLLQQRHAHPHERCLAGRLHGGPKGGEVQKRLGQPSDGLKNHYIYRNGGQQRTAHH